MTTAVQTELFPEKEEVEIDTRVIWCEHPDGERTTCLTFSGHILSNRRGWLFHYKRGPDGEYLRPYQHSEERE